MTQILFLGLPDPVPALGASGAIFGIMAIALFWAPANQVYCPISLALGIEVPLMMFAFFYLASNFSIAWISEFALGSSLLHLLGAVAGGVIGATYVKMRLVDCEGYDLFSYIQAKEGRPDRQPKLRKSKKELHQQTEQKRQIEQQKESEVKDGLTAIQLYLGKGQIDMAIKRFAAVRKLDPTIQWSKDQLQTIIRDLHQRQQWELSIPFLEQHIQRFDSARAAMQLKLARILLLARGRPRAALKVLKSIDIGQLSDKGKLTARQLMSSSIQRIEDGEIELGTEDGF